ncbi:regulator of G protein signaling superfamily [Basidiobolus meristosporus CBS 931.73]|uniref:Regulator of G protein signaling superfamily n=1 Tax=Basidiobolus meristosporus CBS 931.73 TaxID=1314790 RepID=A0A1Y1XXS2_9FUNG|nr:regulator of G protein signaling superfamily [Basidiobolus meristosporus CBS 931.73]|eukprot:ORX90445.1 regulator of G protein signaling superfamily [Basidiobolus meristosporus CBS 931.73]
MTPAAIPGEECPLGWEFYPFMGSLAIYLFLGVPVLLYWFWGIDDVYGIRKELLAVAITSMIGFFLYLIFMFLPSLRTVEKTFAAYVWGAITLVLIHTFFVIYPIYELRKSRQVRANAKNTQVFDKVLSDPVLFEDFKAFTIKDFSVENPLFYERCRKLRESVTHIPRFSAKVSLSNKQRIELRSMYDTFINPKSEFQVNLSSATIEELTKRFDSGELALNMFSRAEWEIHLLMYQNTFPRYLKYTSLTRV